MRLLISLFVLCLTSSVSGQLIESELPIIIINTHGNPIEDEPKTEATIGIIFNGKDSINNILDATNEYSGLCGIELRGSSSLDFAKKSYGLEMWNIAGEDIDTSFLGFKKEEDFILNGPYSDKSLMNNAVVFQLARDMGQYASQTQYVELIINDEYMGLYVLMEKIKRDKNRIDISKLKDTDISGDDLTGGYIIIVDHFNENGWYSEYDKNDNDEPLYIQYVYPKIEDLQPQQATYIQGLISEWEDALASPTYINDQDKHYTEYINLRSFVDNFIINELSKNVDAYSFSSYFYKDKDSKGGRIIAGPVWDYNLSLGNASFCNSTNPDGWMYYQCPAESPFWWDRLLNSSTFTGALKCRWEELRTSILSDENLLEIIDANVSAMGEAVDRNFQRWPIMGHWIWPNPDYFAQAQSHAEVVFILKDWLLARLLWMDENIPGEAIDCSVYDNPDFEVSTGTTDFEINKLSINIYPNPSLGQISVQSSVPLMEIWIIDKLGRVVYTSDVEGTNFLELDLSAIKSDDYYVLKARTRSSVKSVHFSLF